MAFTITVEGVDDAVAKLTKLSQLNRVRKTISQQGVLLQRYVRTYPKKVYSPNPLIKSDPKVRRGFFARLKSGEIQVPYRRTRKLGNSWSVHTSLNGFSVTVENNMPYAPLVQGWDEQVTRHKWSGWITEKGAMMVKQNEIIANINKALEQEVKSAQ